MAWDGEAGSSGEYISLARLVRRAQAGERGAFDELYARTAQVQYFALVGKVGREAADDLLQELYLIAWENIASVRPRSFVGYLNATARNLCLWHFKRQGTSKEPTPAEDRALEEIGAECGDVASDGAVVADPSTTVAAQDERARLAHVLREELDAEERDAVLMRYYQNMKLGEIASALDLSRATVKRRLASALEKFREKMGFAPTGVVFAELLARTVEESPAPRLRLAQRMGARPTFERHWTVRVVGLAAVAIAVGGVVFAVSLPRAEEPTEPGTEEAAGVRDVAGPVLMESFAEGDATILRFKDVSGTEEVFCVGADGARYEAEREEALPAEDVSQWRLSLPSGTYELYAADVFGNQSEGELAADITPDVFCRRL